MRTTQPTPPMKPEYIFVQEVSGKRVRMHSLMSGYFIQMLLLIVPKTLLPSTRNMNQTRRENMANMCAKLNMVFSPHLSSLHLEEWAENVLSLQEINLNVSKTDRVNITPKCLDGSGADCPTLCHHVHQRDPITLSPRGSDSNNMSLATCEGKIPSI